METIHSLTIGATEIGEVEGYDVQESVRTVRPVVDGDVFSLLTSIVGVAPTMDIQCLDLAAALAKVGLGGVIGDVVVWSIVRDAIGAADSAAVHMKDTMASAVTVATSIDASQDGNARLSLQVVGYNAADYPLIHTQALAAPALVRGTPQFFGLGPVKIDGVAMSGVTGWRLDFAIAFHEADFSDGDVYPKQVSVREVLPIFTIRCRKGSQASKFMGGAGPYKGGKALAVQGADVYLRMRKEGVGYELDASAKHIKLSVALGTVYRMSVGGTPRESVFALVPSKESGAGDPVIAIATASAIT